MDTWLTLVIALGGIATGIGAIWTAMLARRQLSEQRRFLEEQTEIARSQARLTERSLAQTERNLTDQAESLREQNERARLNLEYELLTRLQDRFLNPHWLSRRRAAAKYLLDNAFVEDRLVGIPSLNYATRRVCGYYEEIAEMQSREILGDEAVWTRFSALGQAYWLLCKPGIEKLREEWQDPTMYELFEGLIHRIAEMDRERGAAPPTREVLRQIMEDEAVVSEEPPATTE